MEEIAAKKQNTAKRIGEFFDRNFALFFAPMIVAFLYIFMLWHQGVYPFGNRYTVASYDLSAQICPFIEHIFDVFDGKSTLTFSYAIAGGADVTGSLLYCFISPFSFLFLIFGDGRVAQASSIVMLCKLVAISVAGTWFAKKLFQGIPDYICIAVGVVYTYCGYTFVASTYINWVDFLIYLPFCAGAFIRFVKTGKFLPFSILVACCIYTCFSIACFSLFLVFPILIFYALLCVDKGERSRFITRLCISFGVALLIALPVLLPALKATSVSGRGGGLFESLWRGFEGNTPSGSFNEKAFVDSFTDSTSAKWSYIFSDSVFVLLTCIWIFRKGMKDKFARFMVATGIILLLPCIVDESMNLLNMGSYMSYALRFGFLNALYFLGGACLCIEKWCYKPFADRDGAPLLAIEKENAEEREATEEIPALLAKEEEVSALLVEGEDSAPENLEKEEKKGGRYALKDIFNRKNTKPLLWAGLMIVVGLAAFIFLAWFTYEDNYKIFLGKMGSELKWFQSSFAHSLGGLEVSVWLFLFVAVVTFVGCFLVDWKKISPRLLSYVLIAVVGLQVVFYNTVLVTGNLSDQHLRWNDYSTMNEQLIERNGEDEYFRVSDYSEPSGYATANIPFTAGSNSFSVFSSVIDADNFATYFLFGYLGNGKNSYKSTPSNLSATENIFADSFLGYKYFITTESSFPLDYATPVYALDEQGTEEGEKVPLHVGKLYAYENPYVFPLGYRVKGEFRFEAANTKSNRFINQRALYRYLSGEEYTGSGAISKSAVKRLSEDLHSRAADVKVSAGKITAKVTAESGEHLLLNFVASEGYSVTVNGKKAKLLDNDLNFLSVALEKGENEVVFTYSSPYVRSIGFGFIGAVVGLVAVAFVLKKTKWADKIAPVVSWVGVIAATVIVAFFLIFPTGVFLSKCVELLKIKLL